MSGVEDRGQMRGEKTRRQGSDERRGEKRTDVR